MLLVAQGYTNQQIADQLGLSVKTVETYRTRMVEKLGLRSRVDLVRYGLDSGLFKTGPTDPEAFCKPRVGFFPTAPGSKRMVSHSGSFVG